jgi:calcium-dependent protein kinase
VLTFIASQITTQQEKDDLQQVFAMLDRDGNGRLTKEELVQGYLQVFPYRGQAEAEAKKIIELVDTNNSGEIDFTEFIVAAMNNEKLLSRAKMDQAFQLFDLVSLSC